MTPPRTYDDVLVQSVKVMEALGAPGKWIAGATGMSRASVSGFVNGDRRPGVPSVRPPVCPRRSQDEQLRLRRIQVRVAYADRRADTEAHAAHLAERRPDLVRGPV